MKTVIQKEDVLEKAIRTRYYFDIQGILDAMQKDGLIKPDGRRQSQPPRGRVSGEQYGALPHVSGPGGDEGKARAEHAYLKR